MEDNTDDVKQHQKLREKALKDGWVYVKIMNGMYGLLRAGLLAQDLLKQKLEKHGYTQNMLTPGLWKHHR